MRIGCSLDVDAAAKYEEFVRALMLDVANGPRRPEWKPDSFYWRYVAR